ncbi:hypothetical protein CPT_Silvanus_033 [Stenotrophomonas phage Silvanus]|nr:hypothetical protein CPT_Silvanus_033 [Stenotrophomonas phage Silvanus]
MKVQARTPIGRIVQGGVELQPKTDDDNKPVLDSNGNQVHECFIALAIPKNDPEFPAFYQQMHAVAQGNFPAKFDPATGQLRPGVRFAMKLQDGDGYDGNGKPVSDKEGFAGHWILKMATRFAPRCFPANRYDPASEMQEPGKVIKRGHWIRCSVVIDGNGVEDNNTKAVQGLFISPNLIEYVGIGDEITSGPSAADVFGAAPIAQLPPGVRPVGNIATVGNPGALPTAATLPPPTGTPALPPVGAPVQTPALPAVQTPALPAVAAAPVQTPALPPVGVPTLPPLTAPVQAAPAVPTYGPGPNLPPGMTVEMALAQPGYTPDVLKAHGYIVQL